MSESEEEKEEEKETLKEKIDRLALESSENDEDFDVSDQVLYFCLTFDVHFFILDGITQFVVDSNGVSRSQSIYGFEENSVI